MNNELDVRFSDMIACFSRAVDLVSPIVAGHQRRVVSIAVNIAREAGLPEEKTRDLALAGALHDVGGLSLAMRVDAMQFEVRRPHEHAVYGYLLLNTFRPFACAAAVVRFHHVDWQLGAGTEFSGEKVPLESHILHLADRVAILIKPQVSVLTQVKKITGFISELSGSMFHPDLVHAFGRVSRRESFWLDAVDEQSGSELNELFGDGNLQLGEDLIGLTRLFCRVIDFRSHYTSSHTSGVAACAVALAELAGFSEFGRRQMMVAGFIHDLGKLAVPAEILEKSSALTRKEYDIIRTHAYHTDHILRQVRGLDTIRKWGALHHERLDGKGYPYHLTDRDLPLGSRIMSVADVFVALTEDRPYRKGMSRDDVLRVLERMAQRSALDGRVVGLLETRFDEINDLRVAAQDEAEKEYVRFVRQAGEMLEHCGSCEF